MLRIIDLVVVVDLVVVDLVDVDLAVDIVVVDLVVVDLVVVCSELSLLGKESRKNVRHLIHFHTQ